MIQAESAGELGRKIIIIPSKGLLLKYKFSVRGRNPFCMDNDFHKTKLSKTFVSPKCRKSGSSFRNKETGNLVNQGFRSLWSIGKSNPCSAKNMVATPHCGARFLFFEAGTDEISATGGHQFLPLSNAFSAISKSGMRTLRARINKSGHPRRVSGLFVEHRGVEPLTSTMRMSRADKVFVLTPQLLQ